MQLAIASGKGGTGKTTLATNLAWIAAQQGHYVTYLDCDVEEPNGHIFLRPEEVVERPITKWVPHVDAARCELCGACGDFCQYGAIARAGQAVTVFPDNCHSCGGCALVCPSEAIVEIPHSIGTLRIGTSGMIRFIDGTLHVGQPMGPPAIRAVKDAGHTEGLMPDTSRQPLAQSFSAAVDSAVDTAARSCDRPMLERCEGSHGADALRIIDAPPGTSCSMVEAVRGSDMVVLVTDPTPFGVHDLGLACETVAALGLPMGVVINRAGLDDAAVRTCCRQAQVPILGELPDDREVAHAYSRGQLACGTVAGYRSRISEILQQTLTFAGASCKSLS